MTCKVTVRGKDKDRFEFLSNKFGQRAALQAILDADPNVEIDGFLDEVEIGNRVNAMAFSTLKHVVLNANGKTVLDIGTTLQAIEFERALISAKTDLETILEEAVMQENSNKATRAFVALQGFEDLVPKIKQRLESFSLKVSDKNNDIEEILKEENDENAPQRVYAKESIETSRLDTMSPQIKLYIASLAQEKLNEEGEVESVLDDLGMEMPVNFHDVYSVLSKNLAGAPSFESMIKTMQELAETNLAISAILGDIENGIVSPTVPVILKDKKINNFENAFFTSFKSSHNESLTITTETRKDKDTGESVLVSTSLNTNKRRLDNKMKTGWAQEFRRIYNTPAKAKEKLWEEKGVKELFFPFTNTKRNEIEREREKLYKRLNNTKDIAILHQVQKMLEFIGIDVTVEALVALRKNQKKYGKSFAEFVYGDNPSISSLGQVAWTTDTDIFKEESKTIWAIANAAAKISTDLSASSYINGEGNQVYPLNLPTAATELFEEFSDKSSRLQDFLGHPLMSPFRILKNFNKKEENTQEVRLFDTLYDNDRNEGTPFDKLDPASSIIARFKAFMNYNADGKESKKDGWFMVPTPADRSGTTVFKTAKLDNTNFSFEGLLQFGEFKEWTENVILGEFERIKLVRAEYDSQPDKSKLVKEYHYNSKTEQLGNGGYFNYYPSLNEFLVIDETTGELKDFDVKNPNIAQAINAAIVSQIKADLDYMESIGVVKPMILNVKGQKIYEDFKATDHVKTLINPTQLKDKNIMSFIVNSIVNTHELSVILNGDLAFYKPMDLETGNQDAQLADANKRAGLAYTPGRKLRIGPGGSNPNFKVAFMEDVTTDSLLFDQYSEVLGKEYAKQYKGMKITDGQGLVSLDRYADIFAGMGELTPALLATINELKKENIADIIWEKVTVPIQPVKGFLQGQRYDDTFGRVMPQNLKYSLIPMIPSAISSNPTMQKLYAQMKADKIDELVFATGSKFGAYNLNTINQEGSLSFVTMSNEDWRMPQIVPYKEKTSENFGTQIRKLIMGNLQKDAMYGNQTGAELQANYQAAISENLKQSFIDLLGEIMENGTVSAAKVARKVLNDLSKNAFKSTSDFITKALEIVTLENGSQTTRIPMSFPAIKHRIESSLNSMVRKAVTKQSVPGFSAVQYTGLGYSQEATKIASLQKELKFVRLARNGVELTADETKEYLKNLQNRPKTAQKTINVYWGQSETSTSTRILSNLAPRKFTYESIDGIIREYGSVEHAYQSNKNGKFDTVTYNAYVKKGGYGIKIAPKLTEVGKRGNLQIMRDLVVESFIQNPESEATKKLLQYDNFTHNTNELIDKAFLEGLNLAKKQLLSIENIQESVITDTVTVLPAEVIISPQYFIQSLKKKRNEENVAEVDALIKELKSGTIDINKIPEALRTVVLYRIPTQGKNSMLPAVIVGFTPEGMGSTIVIPGELVTQSGSDYDIDKVYVEMKHFDYNESGFSMIENSLQSKEGRDNTIVDTHLQVLTSPNHFKELITPNNSDTLNELAKDIASIYSADKTGRLWSSLATQDDFREKNQAGGMLIGVMSIANTAHALFQELGVQLQSAEDMGVWINGTEVKSLSNTYTFDSKGNTTKRLISDDHIEGQTAAVDNVKNPVAGELNLNMITSPTYLFLLEAGAGIPYAIKLLNTPIIRELVTKTRQKEATMGADGAFQTALSELIKDKKISLDSGRGDYDIRESLLDNSIEEARKGNFSTPYDADILRAFMTFRSYGRDMNAVQSALKTDNDGARQTLAANVIQWDKLAQVSGTMANETYSKEYALDEVQPITTISLNREKYKSHSIAAFELYGLKKAIDLTGVFIKDSSQTFKKVLKDFQRGIGGALVESDLRMLMNDFYTYLYANKMANIGGKFSAFALYDSTDIAQWLVGKNSVGKQVLKMQKAEELKAKADVSYQPNRFLRELSVELENSKNGFDIVAFNNTIGNTLSSDQKAMLSSEYMKMVQSDDADMNQLGVDLFMYNFFTEGFGRGVNSFSDYISVEMYEGISNPQTSENFVEYFTNISGEFGNQLNFNTDAYLVKFLQLRGKKLKGIKNLSKRNSSQVEEFLKANPKVKYFIAKGDVIGMRNIGVKTEAITVEWSKLGAIAKNDTLHNYYNGESIINGESASAILEKSKISEDVVDNNQCEF